MQCLFHIKLWQFECMKKGEVFNKPFLFLLLCFCVCVSIPADYPPPPPPVEDSTSFPPSSGSFPPPPMNSYDYQVREKCGCITFSWLSVSLWKSTQKAETAQSLTLSSCNQSSKTVCPFELQPVAEMASSRCFLEPATPTPDPHTSILSSLLRALMQGG